MKRGRQARVRAWLGCGQPPALKLAHALKLM
jgi:hypothetical protein